MTENGVMTPKSCESCTFTMVSTESEPCYSCRGMRNYTKDIVPEHESLRELNRDLVDGLEEIVSGIDEADELHESGVAIDWQIVVRAKALIAKARGEK